jgi:predicted RNA binding protein YcfA (HicA-like mRNA interferase family)
MLPKGLSGREIIRALKRRGWIHTRTKGSHAILTHPDHPQNLPVPLHDEIGRGLLRKIIHDADLTVDEFTDLL